MNYKMKLMITMKNNNRYYKRGMKCYHKKIGETEEKHE